MGEHQSRGASIGQDTELHQQRQETHTSAWLTTDQGIPVSDNQNSLKSGARGPTLLEDFVLREKIFHFDHERIPERIVHARGSGAHGYFELSKSLSAITTADLFQREGERTPIFARISTVVGGAGSADTVRDVRGFAVKFYTKAGNWDLVGNNVPVFFIQDAMKFPDLVHSIKMEADRGYPQAAAAHDTFWDWASLMPESTHMLLWLMSDHTLPRSLRMTQGFGVHTFQFINAKGDTSFVKFHWRPVLGVQSTVWDETLKLQSADSDFHRRDLWEAIASGDYPEWELGIQTFDQRFADSLPYDVLDATKLIPEEDVPVQFVGRMVLNRNPDNFFSETEQAAFCQANIVPGIDFSNDPLLQGRLFSYLDTQKSRLGTTNFHQLPINAPKCPFSNFHRDGMMQTQVPKGRANYEPNSLAQHGEIGGPREVSTGFQSAPGCPERDEQGDKLRVRPELFSDHYSQARQFWKSQTRSEQAHIVSAFTFELSKVQLADVPSWMIGRLRNVDEDLAKRVAEGLGVGLPAKLPAAKEPIDMVPSLALSVQKRMKATLRGRRIGLLISEGSDGGQIEQLRSQVHHEGGSVFLVATKLHGIRLADGKVLKVDGQLSGSPSVLFDAVAIILSGNAAQSLINNRLAVHFVADAYMHLKAIGHNEAAGPLLEKANVVADDGVTSLGSEFLAAASRRFWERETTCV